MSYSNFAVPQRVSRPGSGDEGVSSALGSGRLTSLTSPAEAAEVPNEMTDVL